MSQSNTIKLYHIATNLSDFKSFFREGAKTPSGQSDKGFYVWTDEKSADTHFQLLDGHFLNKTLKNHEAIMIGLCLDKKDITYPSWQLDVEFAPGLYELLGKYIPSIEHQKWDINLPPNNSFLKKITGFSCQKKDESIQFVFKGKTSINTDMNFCITHHNNQPCQNSTDTIFFQALTNTLYQHNNDFREAYNQLMQHMSGQGGALKYTGTEPLPISFAKHMSFDNKGNVKKTVVFDKEKETQQICPFLKIKNSQR